MYRCNCTSRGCKDGPKGYRLVSRATCYRHISQDEHSMDVDDCGSDESNAYGPDSAGISGSDGELSHPKSDDAAAAGADAFSENSCCSATSSERETDLESDSGDEKEIGDFEECGFEFPPYLYDNIPQSTSELTSWLLHVVASMLSLKTEYHFSDTAMNGVVAFISKTFGHVLPATLQPLLPSSIKTARRVLSKFSHEATTVFTCAGQCVWCLFCCCFWLILGCLSNSLIVSFVKCWYSVLVFHLNACTLTYAGQHVQSLTKNGASCAKCKEEVCSTSFVYFPLIPRFLDLELHSPVRTCRVAVPLTYAFDYWPVCSIKFFINILFFRAQAWRNLVRSPWLRESPPGPYITDVYEGTRWKDFLREMGNQRYNLALAIMLGTHVRVFSFFST